MVGSYHMTSIVQDDHLAAQLRRAEELQAHFHVQSAHFRRSQRAYHQRMQAYYARKIAYHERMAFLYKSGLLDSTSSPEPMALTPAPHIASLRTNADALMPVVAAADEDITDEQWEQVAPLLPLGSGRGRPYIDDRRALNGVLYVTMHHIGWSHMPARYGSYVTCWRRYLRWQAKGVWPQVLRLLHCEATDVFPGKSQERQAVAVSVADMHVPTMYTTD